ncbi:MAG: hypothetical protein KDJ75_08195 [Alphaproteobacteria bacterium]|nr:hypothetical protein [Alphaproteobacteria bacterium]
MNDNLKQLVSNFKTALLKQTEMPSLTDNPHGFVSASQAITDYAKNNETALRSGALDEEFTTIANVLLSVPPQDADNPGVLFEASRNLVGTVETLDHNI